MCGEDGTWTHDILLAKQTLWPTELRPLIIIIYGGKSGIRTHATFYRPISLAGRPLKPLEYLSIFICVALPGFEPERTDPKSVVLPLHHRAIFWVLWRIQTAVCDFADHRLFARPTEHLFWVSQKGFEPLTLRLEIWCSIQLSYWDL